MGYTKAPWTFDLDDMEIRGQCGRIVELAPRMEAIHNGRLISAAPDLLASLRLLTEKWSQLSDSELKHIGFYDIETASLLDACRSAISRAENG